MLNCQRLISNAGAFFRADVVIRSLKSPNWQGFGGIFKTRATKLADGKYQVQLTVASQKLRADETGTETEIPHYCMTNLFLRD